MTTAVTRPIKSYALTVDGFPPVNYSARKPSAARARAWRDYTSAYDVSFKRFLQISRIARIPDPAGVGRRILVGGEPATTVIGYGQYVHFMRDDSDVVLCAHPNDVAPMPSPSPIGIQRQRSKGWHMPPNTISVTRPGKWGNRWRVGDVVQRFSKEKVCETFTIETPEQAVACFREDMEQHLANPKAAPCIIAALRDLRGKNLACWCALGHPCHRNVLLDLANGPICEAA